ncbi:hypothetical protein FRP1_21920 [Pseudonocardia sp. EC080625-04]|nr:hypothetical protein FRP1_21920 [Pseudonocardia sp. EC080625-04]ALL81288.1 hypothetical protein AD017_08915 [Pseudonocardia sp. EC080619-01]
MTVNEFWKAVSKAQDKIEKAAEKVQDQEDGQLLLFQYLEARTGISEAMNELHETVIKRLRDLDPMTHKTLTQAGSPPPLVASEGKYLVEQFDEEGELERKHWVDNRYEAVVLVKAFTDYLEHDGEGLRLMASGENDHLLAEGQRFVVTKL